MGSPRIFGSLVILCEQNSCSQNYKELVIIMALEIKIYLLLLLVSKISSRRFDPPTGGG